MVRVLVTALSTLMLFPTMDPEEPPSRLIPAVLFLTMVLPMTLVLVALSTSTPWSPLS